MTDINAKIKSISYDKDRDDVDVETNTVIIYKEEEIGVVVDLIGKTFEIEEIKTLLKHMEYIDKLEEGEE
tara:strand:- start:3157 stop:3366 length:210 start_codon:yes stop_codon:yes gene_type:complete